MTPGAQVAAAIDILTAIDTGDRPADDVAADYIRRRRYIGAKDRAHIAGHVYAVLRHRAALDWWIGKLGIDIGPRSRILASLVITQGWRPEASRPAATATDFGPHGSVDDEERLVRDLAGCTLHHPEMPRAVANDLPEWLEPYLERVFGKELEREMAALNMPAPTDLRVNLLKADRQTARRVLAAEGVKAEPTPLSPLGLRLARADAARQPGRLQSGARRSTGRKLADRRAARRRAARHAGRRFLRWGGRQDFGVGGRDGQSRQARRLRGVAPPPRAFSAPAAPRRGQQRRAPRADRRAR